jgi:CheY-like chemotaxis protein
VPPWHVLLLHALFSASATALINWSVRVMRSTVAAWSAASRRAAAVAAASRAPTIGAGIPPPENLANDSFFVSVPAVQGNERPGGTALPGGTIARLELSALGAVHLVLRQSFAYDMAAVIKMSVVLTFLVYSIDIQGGWARYNILGLAALCAGHANVLANYLARVALDPAPAKTDDSLLRKLVTLLLPRWGASSVAAVNGSSALAAVQKASQQKPKRGVAAGLTAALDVRVLKVIGAEIDQVTFRAFVFTLHGCFVPLLFTHVAPALIALAPYFVVLIGVTIAVIRLARVAIVYGLKQSPIVAFLTAVASRAVVVTLLLWIAQSAVLLATAFYMGEIGVQGSWLRSVWAAAEMDLAARAMPPTEYYSIVGRDASIALVPFLGQLF